MCSCSRQFCYRQYGRFQLGRRTRYGYTWALAIIDIMFVVHEKLADVLSDLVLWLFAGILATSTV